MSDLYQIGTSQIYRFSFEFIDSNMYLLLSGNRALAIDPIIDETALQLLKDKQINDILIIPTHEHYDHISGINTLRQYFECTVLASEACANNLIDPKRNLAAYSDALFIGKINGEVQKILAERNASAYQCSADATFKSYICLYWEGHKIEIRETPGHSKGSVCIIIDQNYVFTGDSLIRDTPVITQLPGGNKKDYNNITLPFLKSLPATTLIFPGHGEPGVVFEFLKPS